MSLLLIPGVPCLNYRKQRHRPGLDQYNRGHDYGPEAEGMVW